MICASDKQRDYWLGMLAILGRINPLTSDDDPTLRHLIDVVPFGLPAEPPQHTRPVLKGVYPSIAPHDKVILWGGGIWNWFDAPTMIKAMSVIGQHRPEVKLFFMGVNRPNVAIPTMPAVEEAMALSRELDLYNQHVFFNDWVPYADRQNYLLEADLGVSLHRDHAEARFAFRTRFLDYLWAGLPILATEGDILSEAVQKWGLGQVVKAGDVPGVVKAVLEMLDTPDLREACQPQFKQVAAQYRWEKATRPLVEFCLKPRQAPDRAYLQDSSYLARQLMYWENLSGKAWDVVKLQGVSSLPSRITEYLRWKFQRR
jgi:glycosyltransferase involved in cell wall biosynthesis